MGHGLPYLQLKREAVDSDAIIKFADPASTKVLTNSEGTAVLAIDGRHYAAFAPAGEWKVLDGSLTSDLGGRLHFSVAALPNPEVSTVTLFEKHAFAFVKSTAAN